jgi:hypothetical protein
MIKIYLIDDKLTANHMEEHDKRPSRISQPVVIQFNSGFIETTGTFPFLEENLKIFVEECMLNLPAELRCFRVRIQDNRSEEVQQRLPWPTATIPGVDRDMRIRAVMSQLSEIYYYLNGESFTDGNAYDRDGEKAGFINPYNSYRE